MLKLGRHELDLGWIQHIIGRPRENEQVAALSQVLENT